MAVRFRMLLQHTFNPLHIYCRLCDSGLPHAFAVKVSSAYERFYRYLGLSRKLPR